MKLLLAISLFAIVGISCSNPRKAEEADRKNFYQAQFFHEQGFSGRALEHAKKIKKTSPRFNEAQELVDQIEGSRLDPDLPE